MSKSTPAVNALAAAGIEHRLLRYRHDPSVRNFGAEVASALGLDPRSVFKTLVVTEGSLLAVAVVPVTGELDLRALAGVLGVKSLSMAEPRVAERQTGYVVGGISPLGQKRRLPTVIDLSAVDWPTVYVSAGRRGLELELAPADLIAVTGACLADVALDQKRI